MLSRCTDAETACPENFCLQIMRAAAFKKNEIFYILDCWLGSAAGGVTGAVGVEATDIVALRFIYL